MRYKIYSIRDRQAEVFDRPFYMISHGLASRAFTDEINRQDANNALSNHPEDFDLWHLGEFDDNSGEFHSHEPKKILSGLDVSLRSNGNAS